MLKVEKKVKRTHLLVHQTCFILGQQRMTTRMLNRSFVSDPVKIDPSDLYKTNHSWHFTLETSHRRAK